MGFVEEEKEYVPGIHVRAASIDKLAALAVDCFGTCNNWTAIVLEVKRLRYVQTQEAHAYTYICTVLMTEI